VTVAYARVRPHLSALLERRVSEVEAEVACLGKTKRELLAFTIPTRRKAGADIVPNQRDAPGLNVRS
jgi:hypothetical protein